MSRILLIKPRFLIPEFSGITQPMGLMYIGAMLKKAGHEPRIHDCAVDFKDLHILRRTIHDWKPDFVGISIIITELEQTKKIMEIIRKNFPGIPVTFGGPWPTANPEKSIKEFGADFVVMGEGEKVFPELIDAVNRGFSTDSISGIASLINGKIKINQASYLTEKELNNLPFPAWELLDNELYKKNNSQAVVGCRSYMTILTSRGCPFHCIFCHHTMGKVFRKRSAQSVLNEIKTLYFKYGFTEFEIVDDCFNLDRERMQAILSGVCDINDKFKLHFSNGLRSDILEPEDMSLFKRAGTVSACFAIETVSSRLQKIIRKNLDIERATAAINAAVKNGIYSTGFFMLGFPTETYEEASDTVEYALQSSLHRAVFFTPKPFEGTELSCLVSDKQINGKEIIDPRNINYYNSKINVSAMSDRDLQKIFRSAYIRFYFNPKKILKLIICHPQRLSLPKYALLTLIKILPKKYHIS